MFPLRVRLARGFFVKTGRNGYTSSTICEHQFQNSCPVYCRIGSKQLSYIQMMVCICCWLAEFFSFVKQVGPKGESQSKKGL